ncbi:type 4b pilus protein PilO2 [Pseudomonas putida]|uniref:Type 4b pilus protein PilO2 n=1 Tax=Pseudomonas putida TaxID=303 RepID=A0A8I1EAQ7_PSEPU|nr:type 4b pilus protein PilO2 [Pseudomonas putida]MBI6883005.1 type 4b pilus protein PilO2 [Pseudomonas putida]
MEQILDIGGRRFVVGLEWIKLAGTDSMLAAKVQAKNRKSPLGVIRTVDIGEGQKLSQVGLSHKKFNGVVHSAAAQLANLYPSMIAIDRISDDLFWICVTENGRVLPGHDTPAHDSEIKRIFSDLASEYQIDYMDIIAPRAIAEMVGVPGSYQDLSPLSLLEKPEGLDSTKLKNLAGISNTTYLGAAIGALLIGWFGYMKYADYLRQKELERQLALESMEEDARIQAENERLERLRQQPTDDQLLQRAREQEIRWLQDDFNTNPMNAVMGSMYTVADHEPSFIRGWKLQGIAFDPLDLKSVSSRWLRGSGRLQDLDSAYEGKASVAFSSDLDAGVIGHPIKMPDQGIVDILDYIKTSGMDYKQVTDRLVDARLSFKVSIVPDLTRRETIVGLTNKTLEGTPQLIMRKRKFEVTGTTKSSFVQLMKTLEPVHNMLASSVLINRVDGGFSWKFTGILHEL